MMKQTISGVRGPHSSCPGIPEQDRQTYDREIQECTKAHTVKTPVVGMAKRLVERSPKPTTVKHIIKREENRICFSKQTVKVRVTIKFEISYCF